VFVLRTNTSMSALQVVLRYRNLLAVENTFKTAKALLATRPIFHKTDATIRGQVFCSFLATVLRTELFEQLAARDNAQLEWRHIVDDESDLSEVEVEQDGRRARLRTAPGPTIDAICRALGIALPPVFRRCLRPDSTGLGMPITASPMPTRRPNTALSAVCAKKYQFSFCLALASRAMALGT
jgi:hypothetical protein